MGIITDFFGIILNAIFNIAANFTLIGTLGISIVMFTVVAQTLLTPLKIKQQRSMRAMNRIQPELQKLQKKYANKKDQASQMAMSKEMQALYKKYNANPLSGCLPLLIQLPIIYGLYGVLRQPSAYIDKLGEVYTNIATTLQIQVSNIQEVIANVLVSNPLGGTGISEIQKLLSKEGLTDVADLALAAPEKLGSLLSHFTTEQWTALETIVSPEQFNSLETLLSQKQDFEWFFVNLVDSPAQLFAAGVVLALLIPVISGASTFIFSKITMASSKQMQQGVETPASADTMMKSMNIMMPIMMGFISWTVPTGLALYWVAGNIVMMVQQILVNKLVNKQEAIIDEKFKAEREAEMATKKKKKKKKRVPKEIEAKKDEVEIKKDEVEGKSDTNKKDE
ncbi:MAG: YidC/Oxa1 family membrane protein insertase [Cellulosilyticaceae bacterium]